MPVCMVSFPPITAPTPLSKNCQHTTVWMVKALAMYSQTQEVKALVSASARLLSTTRFRPARRQAAVIVYNLCRNPDLVELLLMNPTCASSPERSFIVEDKVVTLTPEDKTGHRKGGEPCAADVAMLEQRQGQGENVVVTLVRLGLNDGAKKAAKEEIQGDDKGFDGAEENKQGGEEIGTRRMCMGALSLLARDTRASKRPDFMHLWEMVKSYTAGVEGEDRNFQFH
ncbi:unnamed protein product, partial [Choristocarpus tenellus]